MIVTDFAPFWKSKNSLALAKYKMLTTLISNQDANDNSRIKLTLNVVKNYYDIN